MRKMFVALGAAIALLLGAAPGLTQEILPLPEVPQAPQLAPGEETVSHAGTRMYIVRLLDEPAARYRGGVPGFGPTVPGAGSRYDARSNAVQQYISYLETQHDRVLASVNAADRKVYSYYHALNGFAARLTAGEAESLRKHALVDSVIRDYAVDIDTNDTSEFLGLLDTNGGLRRDLRLFGNDVIVGVLDTGAIQDHPSFSDGGLQRYSEPPARWSGRCEGGEEWSADDCNNKLIGARWFVEGFRNPDGSFNLVEDEFLSPRDASGHGTHTASTAAGNYALGTLSGTRVGILSGMAPRARVAAYKVCWLAPGATTFSCFFSDSAAATEAAIEDGVDVLNFSVGTSPAFDDEQDLAFLSATAAGIFVARSAGNSGPAPATTAAGEPWVTSVAASTAGGSLFTLGIDVTAPFMVAGRYSALEGAITQPLQDSGPVSDEVVAADPIEACEPLTNDIGNNIALIARGTCAFTDKIENAVNAGARAILMYTDAGRDKTVMGGTETPLTTSVPGVMIDNQPGLDLLAELQMGRTVEATLASDIFVVEPRTGNIMADFSSRGPFPTETNWLKPDITAPGVNILAGTTPVPASGPAGELFGYLSGTSMSSPHIAGLAALVIEARPRWSPAQVKSALMTSARQDVVKEDGATPADPFDFGAGHVDPNFAVNPGLTYDAGLVDYLAASCGTVSPLVSEAACASFEALDIATDPAELNLPSIAINQLPGVKTVTRTVTAVEDVLTSGASTTSNLYTVSVEEPPGFNVFVDVAAIDVAPGEETTYEVTIANQSAPPGEWRFGSLTLTGNQGHVVRSPIAVNAAAVIAPEEISGTGTSGADQFDITFGYNGVYTAQVHGLNPASLIVGPVEDDPNNSFEFLGPGTSIAFLEEFPAGTAVARFGLFDEYTSGNDDLDMYVYYCPNFLCSLVGSSANPASDESVDVTFPLNDPNIDDPYLVFVHGFETEGGLPAEYALFVSSFGVVDDAGNLDITSAPASATLGSSQPIDFEWAGLQTGVGFKQLGAISHSDANAIQGLTLISIENDDGFGLCDIPIACQD